MQSRQGSQQCRSLPGPDVTVEFPDTALYSLPQTTDFLDEARTLSQFHHENVLSLLGVVTMAKPMQIIIEYVKYGDLRAVLRACRKAGHQVFVHEHVSCWGFGSPTHVYERIVKC